MVKIGSFPKRHMGLLLREVSRADKNSKSMRTNKKLLRVRAWRWDLRENPTIAIRSVIKSLLGIDDMIIYVTLDRVEATKHDSRIRLSVSCSV
jgi:hypothetical protein